MEEGVLLIKNADVSTHSPQNCIDTCDWKNNALATLRRGRCFLSTIEFGLSTQ